MSISPMCVNRTCMEGAGGWLGMGELSIRNWHFGFTWGAKMKQMSEEEKYFTNSPQCLRISVKRTLYFCCFVWWGWWRARYLVAYAKVTQINWSSKQNEPLGLLWVYLPGTHNIGVHFVFMLQEDVGIRLYSKHIAVINIMSIYTAFKCETFLICTTKQ